MVITSCTISELILGGQKSGKSRRAELLARQWLASSCQHQAVMIATARVWDDEMRRRIERHKADRARDLSAMRTIEEPLQLAQVIAKTTRPDTLIVVDCLTLWLTNWLMSAELMQSGLAAEDRLAHPIPQQSSIAGQTYEEQVALLLSVIKDTKGPLVFVGNEIGLGVIPMGQEVRAFVDTLGLLNQSVARSCKRVTLMAAGLPLTMKDEN
jgi:adenosylcobinamide kinase / adenosylcobinamide-phosphate guanylyltransferase